MFQRSIQVLPFVIIQGKRLYLTKKKLLFLHDNVPTQTSKLMQDSMAYVSKCFDMRHIHRICIPAITNPQKIVRRMKLRQMLISQSWRNFIILRIQKKLESR